MHYLCFALSRSPAKLVKFICLGHARSCQLTLYQKNLCQENFELKCNGTLMSVAYDIVQFQAHRKL